MDDAEDRERSVWAPAATAGPQPVGHLLHPSDMAAVECPCLGLDRFLPSGAPFVGFPRAYGPGVHVHLTCAEWMSGTWKRCTKETNRAAPRSQRGGRGSEAGSRCPARVGPLRRERESRYGLRHRLSVVKRAVTSWMSDNHFSSEAVRSAHSVVDVRPLRRPTAEVEPRAAEPALDYLEPELRDRDW